MIINIGDKIGNLTVINFSHKDKWKKSYYVCLCDCGNIVVSRDTSLKFHKTHSCGCIKYTKHGMNRTRLYGIWCNMKSRCRNKNTPAYLRYGERGIAICDEWIEDFRNFLSWALENGYENNLTLDRIDNNKGYFPQNCRWVDMHIQSTNRGINSNNKSGYTGVCGHGNKFESYITIYGKRKNLGFFNTAKEAVLKRNDYIKKNKLYEYKIQEVKSV